MAKLSRISIGKPQIIESASPNRGSAKSSAQGDAKATSAMVIAKNPPRPVDAETKRAAAAKIPKEAGEPRRELATKQASNASGAHNPRRLRSRWGHGFGAKIGAFAREGVSILRLWKAVIVLEAP